MMSIAFHSDISLIHMIETNCFHPQSSVLWYFWCYEISCIHCLPVGNAASAQAPWTDSISQIPMRGGNVESIRGAFQSNAAFFHFMQWHKKYAAQLLQLRICLLLINIFLITYCHSLVPLSWTWEHWHCLSIYYINKTFAHTALETTMTTHQQTHTLSHLEALLLMWNGNSVIEECVSAEHCRSLPPGK